MTTIYTCPAGHDVHADESEDVICRHCNLIATHLNRRSGEVYEWTDLDEYHDNCEALQDQIDGAFDDQYFGGGW